MGVTGAKGSVGQQGWGFGVESGPGDKGFRCAYIGNIADMADQTWNLSQILHRRIFRPTILHHQFHLISTVIKTQKNE